MSPINAHSFWITGFFVKKNLHRHAAHRWKALSLLDVIVKKMVGRSSQFREIVKKRLLEAKMSNLAPYSEPFMAKRISNEIEMHSARHSDISRSTNFQNTCRFGKIMSYDTA